MPVPPGSKITPTILISSLKRTQLRSLASSLGTPISGTKKVLAEGVCAALGRSRFPALRPTSHGGGGGGGGGDGGGRGVRILSVDMGIRNLAVCLLEVLFRPGGKVWGMGEHRYRQRDMMVPSVIAWQRMCIPPSPTTTDTTTNNNNNNIDNENDKDNNNTTCSESIPDESPVSPQIPPPTTPAESFSASTFSRHAYNLATTLLSLSGPTCPPDQILIETQRYRSGGGAAVQEWTLRVNMLESMLWGCLRTLAEVGFWGSGSDGGAGSAKGSCSGEGAGQGGELIEGVNPIKVTGFWEGFLSGSKVVEVERLQTTYVESKKSKTRIVKGLLCPPYICTQSSPEVGIPHFELGTDQARETAELFLEINANGNGNGVEGAKKVREPIIRDGKRRKKQPKGKLDDLADCLLQGLAWVKWEEGRRKMVSGEGFFAGVDIAKLVERAKTLEEGGKVKEVVKKVRRRKVVEEQVGEVGAAAKRKRRAVVKKLDIQDNDTQEMMAQEIEVVSGKGTEQELEVEDARPALIPIVVPAKKPRKPRTKKVPLPEIMFVQPLGSETGAGEGTIIIQDSEEITPQDIISGEEEVEAKLKPVVEVEVKDTHPTSIQTVEPALLPTKKTSELREKKVPLGGIVCITPPELEAEAGEGKVIAQNSEEITPQENVAVTGAVPDMEDIHTVAPAVEHIVEPVPPPPLTKKIRKPRAKKPPSAEVIYIQHLKTEERAGGRMVITPSSGGITRQEIEAVAGNEEAELQPGPEPEVDAAPNPLCQP
ncbi:mitochondrial resolvase Ydc2 [Terfezia claveryi]|nr:mitochondrial resolvase Ydc2 [Terfezia claveryi]